MESSDNRGSTLLRTWRAMMAFGSSPADSAETRGLKRLIVAVLWITVPASSAWITLYVLQGAPLAGVALASVAVVNLLVLGVIRSRPAAFAVAIQFAILGSILGSLAQTLLFGGLLPSGLNLVWGFLGVLGALIVAGYRVGTYWLGAFVLSVAVAIVVPNYWSGLYTLDNAGAFAAANLVSVMIATFLVLVYFIRQRDRFQRESDDLLHNVLPDEIAARLKHGSGMIAERFEAASVLFADLVDFTPMTADMPPVELVALLDDVFTMFDELVEDAGLEKIKTIGDCYMVAAGVPTPRDDHAVALAKLALTMRDRIARTQFGGRRLRFRIGISSGPVVAGIIGSKKFIYDLWGDTVNTASRMESHGTAGCIQITDASHRLISEMFECEWRGVVPIKGKGRLPTWYLIGPRTSLEP